MSGSTLFSKKNTFVGLVVAAVSGSQGMPAALVRVPVPSDPDVAQSAMKLAEFVARNGRSFEEVTRAKNPFKLDSPFRYRKTQS